MTVPVPHVPVLLKEVTSFLAAPAAVLIDGTVGEGGHAEALLRESGEGATLLGMDLDADALGRARDRLAAFGGRVRFVHGTFADIAETARREGFGRPTGILFDLGMSSGHLDAERGFSFHNAGPLDMRFDPSGSVALPAPEHPALRMLARRAPAYTAADVIRVLAPAELADLFAQYGGERHAPRIADAVARVRKRAPIATVPALVRCIVRALPPRARHGRIHAATRTFQALRIAVNREREALRLGVDGALELLPPGGRFAVIAFHSGEDRVVKERFRAAARGGRFILRTTHPARPSASERRENPRSRSARLRVIERAA